MPKKNIATVNPLLSSRLPQIRRCRDFIEGADELRAHDVALWPKRRLSVAGNTRAAIDEAESRAMYLPPLSQKQSFAEWFAYLHRALYYNAPGRTVDGLLGLVFSRPPRTDLPATLAALQEDADLQGTPLSEMLEECAEEIIKAGRFGWLVDHTDNGEVRSKADAEAAGFRPYLIGYRTEDIINWGKVQIGSRWALGRVVLRERYLTQEGEAAERYRELKLDENGYSVCLWTRNSASGEFAPCPVVYPTMRGAPIREIPFYFFDPRGGRSDPVKPPMLDIVEVARSHYQSSADLEHARFTCGLPTPCFFGFSGDEVKDLALGGLNAIHSTNAEAHAEFLEYSGEGTQPLERALSQKAEMMAKLGSRMLSEDKKDAEAAETLRIRASGESATLADIARAISRIASQALTFASEWAGGTGKAEVELNTEYSSVSIDPQEITAILSAVQGGQLPVTDFIRRLRKVGIIEAERTDEIIQEELEGAAENNTGALGAGLKAASR